MRDARLVRAQRLSGRVTELGSAESRSAVLGLKGGGPDLQGDGVIAERAGRIDPAPRAGVLGVEAVGDALGEGSDRICPAPTERVFPSVNNLATSSAGIATRLIKWPRATATPWLEMVPAVRRSRRRSACCNVAWMRAANPA